MRYDNTIFSAPTSISLPDDIQTEYTLPNISQSRIPRSLLSLEQFITSLLHHTVDDLDIQWGGGTISPSAYETAWVALVRQPHESSKLAFPQSLEWLLRHQLKSGLWEPEMPYGLVSSLAALLALLRAPLPTKRIKTAAMRAQTAIQREIVGWSFNNADTPFIEFLVPQLVQLIAQEGIELSLANKEAMALRVSEKLHYFPAKTIYNGKSNLIHAIEALSNIIDYDVIMQRQAVNGSFGYSPSSTAAVLMHAQQWNSAAEQWLRHLLERFPEDQGGMPTSHPSDVFEVSWISYLLSIGRYDLPSKHPLIAEKIRDWLAQSISEHGASFAQIRAMPEDVDDTAMVITVLHSLGIDTPRTILSSFEKTDHFASYAHERISSTSANAHVLEALLSYQTHTQRKRIIKVVKYLLNKQAEDGSWSDKWHISRYYATFSVIPPFIRFNQLLPHQQLKIETSIASTFMHDLRQSLQRAVRWILSTQRFDGGWGEKASTAEETAYAVLILSLLSQQLSSLVLTGHYRALQRGRRFIWEHLHDASFPPLWVDKSLYTPFRVVLAALYAALYSATQHQQQKERL